MSRVGILALQGDVPEHRHALEGVVPARDVKFVRSVADLAAVDALFLPGGESTTIARLLEATGIWTALRHRLAEGFPVLATCAGLILLSRTLEPSPSGRDPPTLGVLDVRVRRNDYGRQRESFEAPVHVEGLGAAAYPGVFIRAPRILDVGPGAQPFAFRGTEVVGVRSGAVWGLTFHPELSGDPRLHRAFLEAAWGQRAAKPQRRRTTTTTTRATPSRRAQR
ncbi:MAG: pyridoxal 5'-phosphate synthase glutaminase subunit PdxT [Thermoplasmata archaeon]|nr:pyridoxal 5'-phosphate synthase glutaminase subunit PdxT [Thermoplasmata archaeon]